MEEDELGKAEEGIGTAAGFDFIDTKAPCSFCVPHFSDAFRGAQEEEEEEAAAAEGVPSGFVLPVQGMFEKCWIRSCRAPV